MELSSSDASVLKCRPRLRSADHMNVPGSQKCGPIHAQSLLEDVGDREIPVIQAWKI